MNDDIFGRKLDKPRGSKGRLRGRCPACNAWVALRDTAEVWDLIKCPECGTLLEVVDVRPAQLDYADAAAADRKSSPNSIQEED